MRLAARRAAARIGLAAPLFLAPLACPTPEAELPQVAGTYPLTITLLDGDCLSQDPSLPPTSFLTWIGANGQAGMLEVEQDGSDLSLQFEGCALGGTVDSAASYYAGGECDNDGGVVTVTSHGDLGPDPADASKGRLDGYVLIDADYLDAGGGASTDGEPDCYREVQIVGTSF